MSKRWLLLLLLMLPFAAVHASPPQQGGDRLTFGQTVNGVIDNSEFRQLYLFSGNAGQTIVITMTRQTGDLDAYLVLLQVDGTLLATNDDDGSNPDAAIRSYQLPMDGDYIIVATRFGHEHGTTTGSYNLTLQNLGAVAIAETDTRLGYGDTVWGELTNQRTEIIYYFEGQRGQVVNIAMKRTSGNLDPLIDLFDGNRQFLISGDDDPTSTFPFNAGIVNYTLPRDDIYFVRATRYGWASGTTVGTYLLSLEQVPVDALGTRPTNARYVRYGELIEATISEEVPARFFQFEATRGDIISVAVTQATGDLLPSVSLLTTDLNRMTGNTGGREAKSVRLPAVTIGETGIYYLSISRFEGFEGKTAGTFTLELKQLEGLDPPAGIELLYGGEVVGDLDDEGYADNYVFLGAEGDVITLRMQRLEGNLDPLLTLRSSNGKQLIANDDESETSQNALISSFTLPKDDIYQIEASRYQRIEGETSGTYSLTLQLEN
ncbi:MAG: PPC domain-containing protein [Anaerolineales bacterium]|nr:PPC domain-containing protein [Anaerolineales bacterium]